MSAGVKLFMIALVASLVVLVLAMNDFSALFQPVDEAKLKEKWKPVVKPYVDNNFGKPMK